MLFSGCTSINDRGERVKFIQVNRVPWVCAWLAGCLLFSPLPASADGDMLSSEVFLVVLLKALNYDRQIGRLSDGKIVIGVVYAHGDDQAQQFSQKMMDAFLKIQSKIQVKNMPAEVRVLDLGGTLSRDKFEDQLKQNHISAVAVASHDPDVNKFIFETTRNLGINSVCNTSECVKHGSGLGIVLKDEKPRMVVNLNAIKLEGSDYSATFLALCDIVQ